MARKRVKDSGTKGCVCDGCGTVERSTIAGSKHRRCGGSQGAAVRAKHTSGNIRGTWR